MNIPAKVQGEAGLDGERHGISKGNMVVIPAGTEHNAINTSRPPSRCASTSSTHHRIAQVRR